MDDGITLSLRALDSLKEELGLLISQYSAPDSGESGAAAKTIESKFSEADAAVKDLELDIKTSSGGSEARKLLQTTLGEVKKALGNLQGDFEAVNRTGNRSQLFGQEPNQNQNQRQKAQSTAAK